MPAAGSDVGGATRHVGTPGGSGSGARQGNRNATGQSRIARVPGGSTCSMGVSRGARGSVTRAVPPAPASTMSRTAVAPAGAITRVSPASVIRRVSVPKSSRTSSPGRSVPTVVTTTRSPRNGNQSVVTCWSTTRPGRVVPPMSTGPTKAARAVKDSDAGRRDYLKRFYEIDEELPTHYDLVVNTDVLSVERAADLVSRAAAS